MASSGDEGALGLNEHHENQIVQYMRFMRYQRGLRVRAIEACFEDAKKSRLMNDTTFTREEVESILDDLQTLLKGETETELINAAHTNVLLLRQLCGQAEKWHLKLACNISELESRELLDAIQNFEEQQFSNLMSSKNKINITVLKKLAPVEGGGVAPLLQAEIDRLQQDNDKLRQKVGAVEKSAVEFAKEKHQLADRLQETKAELNAKVNSSGQPADDGKIDELTGKMKEMRSTLESDLSKSRNDSQRLESDLIGAKKRLLEIQEHLEMAEKELEKKFSQTGAYKNMKQMLNKKNEQLKQMRRQLTKYEPSTADGGEDD